MYNELSNDAVLRDRVQFWLFTYSTSNPILQSADELRRSLSDIVKEVDPEGRDPALRRMVLIGHSQGGLLARLMVSESGVTLLGQRLVGAAVADRGLARRRGPCSSGSCSSSRSLRSAGCLRLHPAPRQLPHLVARC